MPRTLEEMYEDWTLGNLYRSSIESPKITDFNFSGVPTWALIEELKKRPGVIFRANTTKEGLVGTFERAPAIILGVKLPVNDEV